MKIRDFLHNDFSMKNNLKLRKIKLSICVTLLTFSFVIIGYKTITLASVNYVNKTNISSKKNQPSFLVKSNRGSIYDRNGELLATTIKVNSLNINPQEILNKNETIRKLKKIFPQLNDESLRKKLNTRKRHLNLLREISPNEYVLLLKEGIEGIKIEPRNKRVYPNNNLVSHILGGTNIDGKGIAGIEKSFNNRLLNGKDVTVSIHNGIQYITEKILSEQIKKFEAEGGAGIVMNAKNGEIYAITSLPDYNANSYNSIFNENLFNRATKGIYELGSTLKLITAAVAFESGHVKESDVFDVSIPLRVSSRTIRDFHPLNYRLNIPEVIVHSSNIGSAKIAEKFGTSTQLKYLKSLGLMDKLNLEIPELGTPQVRKDGKLLSTMTISYGHGIAITLGHLASATATIVNDGIHVKPTLLISNPNQLNDRIFSSETSKKMKSIMRLVVSSKHGTAKKAQATGYLVGGKTGTAEKVSQTGGYSKNQNIVAFTAAYPMNNPQFVISIMIDNPKGQKFSFGYRTAGWVAAPVIKKLVTRISPILNIKPQTKLSSDFSKGLIKYKIRGKNKGANL
ncbi:MAG: peptidoglycan D,D-transpeptidase FtsI family protein [Candidatus Puniceispirillales bacterium]